MQYPAHFDPDRQNGGYTVTFPDFPEAVTQGETIAEAMERATDALDMAIAYRIQTGEAVPLPSSKRGRAYRLIGLEPLRDAKLALYLAWQESGIRKAELARRMGIQPPNVDRLFRFDRASRLDQISLALAALGKRLVIAVEDAA